MRASHVERRPCILLAFAHSRAIALSSTDDKRQTMAFRGCCTRGEAQQTQLRYGVSAPPEGGRHPALGFYPIFALSVLASTCAFWLRANVRAWTGRGPRSSDRVLWSCHLPDIIFTNLCGRLKEFGRSIAALARPCANTRSKPERTGERQN